MQIAEVSQKLAANAWSVLVVDDQAAVVDLLGFDALPAPIELGSILKNLTEKYEKCAVQCIDRVVLTEEQLQAKLKGIADNLRWAETHDLRPGVNIPPTRPNRVALI